MEERSKKPFLRFPLRVLKIMFAYPRGSLWMLHYVPSFLLLLTQIGYFFNVPPPGPKAVTQSVRDLVSVSVPATKSFFTLLWIHKIDAAYNLIDETETDEYEKFLSPQTKKLLQKQYRRARRICYSIASVYSILCFLAVIPQCLSYFFDAPKHRTAVVNSGPEYMFITSDTGYIIMTLLLTLHSCISVDGATAFDTFYIISSYVISSRAMVLSAMLENVSFALKDLSHRKQAPGNGPITGKAGEIGSSAHRLKLWTGNLSDEEAVYRELIRCVQYHQKICKLLKADRLKSKEGVCVKISATKDHLSYMMLHDLIQEVCSVGLFLTVILIVISTAIAIVFVVLFASDDPSMIVLIAFVAFWCYFQLIYICSWGDEVMEKTGDVTDAAYSVYTAGFSSKRIQQILVLMMEKAQKPLSFSAGRLITLDHKTLVELTRKTYSVCAFALKIT